MYIPHGSLNKTSLGQQLPHISANVSQWLFILFGSNFLLNMGCQINASSDRFQNAPQQLNYSNAGSLPNQSVQQLPVLGPEDGNCVPPVDTTGFTIIEPAYPNATRTIQFTNTPANQSWHDVIVLAASQDAFHGGGNYPTDTPPTGFSWSHFEIEPHPIWAFPGPYWGFRAYNMVDTLVERGYIHNIEKEHAIYMNPAGNITFKNLLLERNGGQAIQLVSRPVASTQGHAENNLWRHNDTMHIKNVCSHENGEHPSRASFPISIAFNAHGEARHLPNILIENFHIRSVFDEGDFDINDQQKRGHGAILIRGNEPTIWSYNTCIIRNGLIELKDNDRSIIQQSGCKHLIVENVNFRVDGNQTVSLDHDAYDARPSGRITWRNNSGNGSVRLGGLTIGSIADDIDVVDGNVR
jgi:hypothetical protein